MRRFAVAAILCLVLAGLASTGAAAAPNPSGTGQPGVECGDEGATLSPAGGVAFSTGGFENAEAHYAGSDGTPSLAHANSSHAVSQYDVTCFQVTSNHPGS
jgi:hypothetical protein